MSCIHNLYLSYMTAGSIMARYAVLCVYDYMFSYDLLKNYKKMFCEFCLNKKETFVRLLK